MERDDPGDKFSALTCASGIGLDAHVTDFDACATDLDALGDPDYSVATFDAPTHLNVPINPDCSVADLYISEHQRDLQNMVDGLLTLPPSASLGRIPTSRLMRQVKSKLADSDNLDAVKEDLVRVGRKGDDVEAIPGLLGTGKWRNYYGPCMLH